MNMVRYTNRHASLVFDFHATTPFDFFPAIYFLIARRLFCFLRRCQFFRASCFMLILLMRRKNRIAFTETTRARTGRILKTRKQIGLTIPLSVLYRADEVIKVAGRFPLVVTTLNRRIELISPSRLNPVRFIDAFYAV